MIVSWKWLKEYLALDVPVEQFEQRLMMAGLNHESTEKVGDDLAVDLEVTSNRPDCLGHLGIAREAAVLFQHELKIPPAQPHAAGPAVETLASVKVECPQLCSRYTARVIQGVKIGPSPAWLRDRLQTIGMASVNNVVDVTNYVMMENGQPLHAFDLATLRGKAIVVREPKKGEKLEAINHKVYELEPGMCVIADTQRAVGLGGVMGGADTEVSESTTDLLIEAAEFDSMSIRSTARKLNLHSPSSYRFERGLDPAGVDWASRRCCELILELAGGKLAQGVIDIGPAAPARKPVVLRFGQLKRILGIDVPREEAVRILLALGNQQHKLEADHVEVIPPSWRGDLSREIDLVEEVARVHGYEQIPEDVSVPMTRSRRTDEDRVLARVRHVLTAVGFNEAMTLSGVSDQWATAFTAWSKEKPLAAGTPIIRGANVLRTSLIPSLLDSRRTNERVRNERIELFEIARVYLPNGDALPCEERMLALTSGGDFYHVKGVIESVLRELHSTAELELVPTSQSLLSERSAEFRLGGEVLGYLGELSQEGKESFELWGESTVAEIRCSALLQVAQLVPRSEKPSDYPPVSRELNLVVGDTVYWAEIAAAVRDAGGEWLESVEYRETYRNRKLADAAKKKVLLNFTLRKPDGTLTGEEATEIQERIVAQCQEKFQAELG